MFKANFCIKNDLFIFLTVTMRVDMSFIIQRAEPTKYIALHGLEMPFGQNVVIGVNLLYVRRNDTAVFLGESSEVRFN